MATQAQALAKALNTHSKSPQFNYSKARAGARADDNVDWNTTKARNDGFNPEVDGCESFVMKDGSVCEWSTPSNAYIPKPK
jgi:hypothetical protein